MPSVYENEHGKVGGVTQWLEHLTNRSVMSTLKRSGCMCL